MKKIIESIFGKDVRNTRKDFELERFQRMAKEQFLKLKEKGLSISVVSL